MKKVTFIILIIFLLIKPYENAYATTTTVPEGLEVPSGIYATATLISGGIASNNTVTQTQEVYEIAKTAWTLAEPTVKQEFKQAIDSAVNAGHTVVQLPQSFKNWYQNEVQSTLVNNITKPPLTSESLENIGFSSSGNSLYAPTGYEFIIYSNGVQIQSATYVSLGSNGRIHWPFSSWSLSLSQESFNVWNNALISPNTSTLWSLVTTYGPLIESGISIGVSKDLPMNPVDNWADQVSKGLEKVFNHVSTNGVSLPLQGISATTTSGEALKWEKTLGKYKLIDGTIYDPAIDGPIEWKIPDINVKTNDDGTVAYNPTNELPVVETNIGGVAFPVLETDFPLEGEYVGNPPIEENPPLELDLTVPETASLNFTPLTNVFGDVTTKFPFSIPWDLKKQLSVFNVSPDAPKIDIDFSKFPYAKPGTKWTLDLSFMNPLAAAARWALTIAIDIAFILMLRRLLPE